MDYNSNDTIEISMNKTYGGVEWNDTSELDISLFLINVSYIYDLYFNNFTWDFKIKLKNDVDDIYINESKSLDISINNEAGLAKCLINKELLECKVDSDEQTENDIIKIINRKKGQIKINNEISHEVSLRIDLEFISSYYQKYNLNQMFVFEINVISKSIISSGSIFYLDIIKNNQNGIAICYYYLKTDNIPQLLCNLQDVPQNSTILLDNNKSKYSDIIWTNKISDNKLEIVIKDKLYVTSVDNLYFNSTIEKWSFIMNLASNNNNYLENSKIIIDLIYTNINNTSTYSTGTCRYNSKKFLCIPDKINQSFLDSFEISKEKREGTAEYSEDSRLDIFVICINLTRAYDLFYNESINKWQFLIETDDYYELNNTAGFMTLDINIDKINNFAICQVDEKLLKCLVESNNQNENQLIRLSEHKKAKIKIINLNSNYFIPLKLI